MLDDVIKARVGEARDCKRFKKKMLTKEIAATAISDCLHFVVFAARVDDEGVIEVEIMFANARSANQRAFMERVVCNCAQRTAMKGNMEVLNEP